jgi:hypothetical protein
MKATVFVEGEAEEPAVIDHNMDTGINPEDWPEKDSYELATLLDDIGLSIADHYIVSEYSLKVAVWSLQSIARISRCHHSRVVAKAGLKMIGETTDCPTDEDGMPEPVPAPDSPEFGATWSSGSSE